jgi:tRNA(Ile)-lysidine synthase
MFSDTTAAEGLSSPEMLEALFADFARYKVVGLAVSGGSDSVALMRLTHAWARQRRELGHLAPALVVLTVDHGLRTASADEARAVGRWAAELGLAHEVLVWQGVKPRAGVQEAARVARYDLLTAWASRRDGGAAVALAHHIEDQAETVLMRLARGSGTDGLAAMRHHSCRDGIELLRPLLDLTKADLVAYLEATGASWIEDPSNQSSEFERVRLRAERPSRERMGLSDRALALTARRLARAADALEWSTDAYMTELMADQPYLALGGVIWPRKPGAPAEVVNRALGRVLNTCGGTGSMGPEFGQSEPGLAAVERMAERAACADFAGATLGRCQISQSALGLVVHREVSRSALPALNLEPGIERIWDGRFVVGVAANGTTMGVPIVVRGWDAAAHQAALAAGIPLATDAVSVLLRPGQPVFWCGERLLAMPSLHISSAFSGESDGQVLTCSARFLNHRLIGRG